VLLVAISSWQAPPVHVVGVLCCWGSSAFVAASIFAIK
jgi:hypothetical protein